MLFTLVKARIRKRRLAQFRAGVTPVFLNLKQVKSIAFLFKLEGDADIEPAKEIIKELKSTKIPVTGIIVEAAKSFKEQSLRDEFIEGTCKGNGVAFIGKKSLNWLGIPQGINEIDEFYKTKYDLVVALNDNGNFTLEYLATRSRANCIAGMENKPNMPYNIVFEQSIAHKGEHASADYVKQLLAYLKNIQSVVTAGK